MDPETQLLVKTVSDAHGAESILVVLGATDPEALQVAAATVTVGDPSYMGPLTGVPLGLQVMHIFEDALKRAIDPDVYESEMSFLELTLDADSVKSAMSAFRAAGPT